MTTKTLKSVMAALSVLLSFSVHAHEVEVDGIYYFLNWDQTATVTYKGGDHWSNYSGSVVIPASFVNEGITYAVTSIGEMAFNDCWDLTSVSIPNSVTSIGNLAFSNCESLTNVVIPNSVTSIGREAFYNCSYLTAVHITDLAAWCKISFDNYNSNPLFYAQLLYLNGEKVTDLVIPNGITSIGDYAFISCSGLTTVDIPNSVTSIGDYAFEGCI